MSNYPQPSYPQGNPPPGYPQDGYPPQQPRSGCGCGGCLGKFLIVLAVIFGLLIALCCGGFYYLKSSVTDQPAEAQKISDEIASLRVPAPLEPVGGGRLKIPFVGKLVAEGTLYSDKKGSVLLLGSFGEALDQNSRDQLMEGLRSGQFQQKPAGKGQNDNREELKERQEISRGTDDSRPESQL